MTNHANCNRKKLFIHIGYHKTGTSAIQNLLSNSIAALGKNNILVPLTGYDFKTHAILANSLKVQSNLFDTTSLYKRLVKEINESSAPKAVISSECFLEGDLTSQLYKNLDGGNFDLNFIIYLRKHDSWINSLYGELIKDNIRRCILPPFQVREMRAPYVNYLQIIKRWHRAFPTSNIIIRPYEKEQMPRGLFVDFLSTLGVTNYDDFYFNESTSRINLSWPAEVLYFLRRINFIPMAQVMRQEVMDCLAQYSNSILSNKHYHINEYLIPAEERAAILNHYIDDYKRIATEYLLRKDGDLFISESSDPKSDITETITNSRQSAIYECLPAHIHTHCMAYAKSVGRYTTRPELPGIDWNPAEDISVLWNLSVSRLEIENQWLQKNLEKTPPPEGDGTEMATRSGRLSKPKQKRHLPPTSIGRHGYWSPGKAGGGRQMSPNFHGEPSKKPTSMAQRKGSNGKFLY